MRHVFTQAVKGSALITRRPGGHRRLRMNTLEIENVQRETQRQIDALGQDIPAGHYHLSPWLIRTVLTVAIRQGVVSDSQQEE